MILKICQGSVRCAPHKTTRIPVAKLAAPNGIPSAFSVRKKLNTNRYMSWAVTFTQIALAICGRPYRTASATFSEARMVLKENLRQGLRLLPT